MEHAEVVNEEIKLEHQASSVANLDMTTLYEWLDRPISEDDDEVDA